MELVGDEDLEGIVNWVEVVDPFEPRMHGWNWKHETGVYNEGQDHDSCQTHCLGDSLGDSGQGAVNKLPLSL